MKPDGGEKLDPRLGRGVDLIVILANRKRHDLLSELIEP